MTPLYVKICGITRVEDATLCVEAGASAIGLNFVPSSKRRVDEATAARIADSVRGRIEIVAVVADFPEADLRRLRAAVGVEWLQLHGTESPDDLAAVLPSAFKAVGLRDATDVRRAGDFGGERLLADAKVDGILGGSGVPFDWSLASALVGTRAVIVAGGLTPANVGDAVGRLRPFGVDVASGVESAPGIKDAAKVRAFVNAARGAS